MKRFLPPSLLKQLEALSPVQLLEVRSKINTLIEKRPTLAKSIRYSSPYEGYKPTPRWRSLLSSRLKSQLIHRHAITSSALPGSFQASNITESQSADVDTDILSVPLFSTEQEKKSLRAAIDLVKEWMEDESEYDKETYSQIEKGLNNNDFSL